MTSVRTRSTPKRATVLLIAAAAVFGLTGCANTPGPLQAEVPASSGADAETGADVSTGEPTGEDLTGTLTIYAAASLTAAFDDLAVAFEQAHPDLDVAPIVYDGSSTLATQIVEGADVDVFASADENNMETVSGADMLAAPGVIFASNTLRIATPPDNPGEIESIADLENPDLSVVLCAPEVPCGNASGELLEAAGLAVTPASEEQNVKAVLTKVVAGEADAGLVYATDVTNAGDSVLAITPENAGDVVNKYPIAALTGAPNPAAAKAFVDFVLSPQGLEVLAGYGFESA